MKSSITKSSKRNLALLLALTLVIGMLPMNVFADDAPGDSGGTEISSDGGDQQGDGQQGDGQQGDGQQGDGQQGDGQQGGDQQGDGQQGGDQQGGGQQGGGQQGGDQQGGGQQGGDQQGDGQGTGEIEEPQENFGTQTFAMPIVSAAPSTATGNKFMVKKFAITGDYVLPFNVTVQNTVTGSIYYGIAEEFDAPNGKFGQLNGHLYSSIADEEATTDNFIMFVDVRWNDGSIDTYGDIVMYSVWGNGNGNGGGEAEGNFEYTGASITPVPRGDLTITKVVNGSAAAEFYRTYTFSVSGTDNLGKPIQQIVNVDASTGSGSTILNLQTGTYTVTETTPIYDADLYTWTVLPYQSQAVEVTADGGEITFTNTFTLPSGSIKIVKEVKGQGGQSAKDGTFDFTISKWNPDRGRNGQYEVVQQNILITTTDGIGEATISDLPYGRYKVTEENSQNEKFPYKVTYGPKDGEVEIGESNPDVTVNVTNTEKTGSLKIIKKVKGEGATNGTFSFTIYKWDDDKEEYVSYRDNISINTRKGTGDTTISGLPYGQYKIVEEDPGSQYAVSYNPERRDQDGGKYAEVKVNKDKSEVTVTNTLKKPETGFLTISKTLVGPGAEDGELDGTFTFTISRWDEVREEYVELESGSPVSIETENGTGSETVPDLLYGKYQVSENDSSGNYAVTYDPADGEVEITKKASEATVNVTNTLKTGSITITKKLGDGVADGIFVFEIFNEDEEKVANIDIDTQDGTETGTVADLPYGVYTVRENESDDYLPIYAPTDKVEIDDEHPEGSITVTNTLWPEDSLGTIQIMKYLVGKDVEGKEFTFTIKDVDFSTEFSMEVNAVTKDSEGYQGWKSREIPFGVYTVVELDADDYDVVYEGLDENGQVTISKDNLASVTVTNTPKPKNVQLKIEKLINGNVTNGEAVQVVAGEQMEITVTITNTGDVPVSGISVSDIIDGETVVLTPDIEEFDGTLVPGDYVIFTYSLPTPAAGATHHDVISVTYGDGENKKVLGEDELDPESITEGNASTPGGGGGDDIITGGDGPTGGGGTPSTTSGTITPMVQSGTTYLTTPSTEADNLVDIAVEETPLGAIEAPEDSTIEDIDIEEDPVPLGSLAKENPKTGHGGFTRWYMIVLYLLDALYIAYLAVNFTRKKKAGETA